ncbi:MAG: hypothetical protein AAGA42_07080 [Actinomycetota bacterium]
MVIELGSLAVTFIDSRIEVDDRLTFGRAGDIELDSNRHLHRQVGAFEQRAGAWWLHNLGSRLFITVVAADGTRSDLAPGAAHRLTSSGRLRISVGPSRYELTYELLASDFDDEQSSGDPQGATTDFHAVLTPREIDFMVSFAQPILDGSNGALPTYAEVAAAWGVSPKTLDNTVQSIRRKMRHARLIRSDPLESVVRTAVSHSLITIDDLAWARLDEPPPRSAAERPR